MTIQIERESDAGTLCRGNFLVFSWTTGKEGVPFIFGRPMHYNICIKRNEWIGDTLCMKYPTLAAVNDHEPACPQAGARFV